MPARLRPTAPIAGDAILVGDPGRALLLAQELLDEPKMSNHARGLWGYGGRTAEGRELTIQSTGMGGPSAAVVLTDLAKLGATRAVRIGTGAPVAGVSKAGELLVVTAARAEGGSAASFGPVAGEEVTPDMELTERLRRELAGSARAATVASVDAMGGAPLAAGVAAVDMQTATLFACGRSLGVALAAVLIVTGSAVGERLSDDELERAAKRAGSAASSALSP